MKHREIKKFNLYEDGGLTIIFKDNSHTYIDNNNMKKMISNYLKIKNYTFGELFEMMKKS